MAEKTVSLFRCMRCGHNWEAAIEANQERVCPKCKSNSVRRLRKPPK